MRPEYRFAAFVGAAGLAAVVWTILADSPAPAGLFVAAAGPVAVLAAVWGRLRVRFPGSAFVGGALIGPIVAVLGHAFVAAFAVAFVLGFAESGRALLDSLRADPRIVELLGSPWVILLLVEYVAVAPLAEEAGKALGARVSRPASRREAFLAGVAAGAGFAALENVLYAGLGSWFGPPWPAIVTARALGAAVHPLATGLVMLGWWEWRTGRDPRALLKGYLSGAAVHALWNGALVALAVAETAIGEQGAPAPLGPVSLAFAGVLGVVLGGVLWTVATAVDAERDPFSALALGEGRMMAAWTVLSASLLVPVAVLALAFPGFYLG